MECPEWYSEWRHDAVHQLQEKNARLATEFKLGSWPRYDYDLETGRIVFSENGIAKVTAEIQVVGTTSANSGSWLWAWANSHLPLEVVSDSLLARGFGEKHGICELSHDYVDDHDLDSLGWELTAVTARMSNAIGGYRPPRDEGGGLFLIYRSIGWAS